MNEDTRCKECRYNIFRTRGGKGKICNGSTMTQYSRCPEWVINEYMEKVKPKTMVMTSVVMYNRIRGVK